MENISQFPQTTVDFPSKVISDVVVEESSNIDSIVICTSRLASTIEWTLDGNIVVIHTTQSILNVTV